MSPRLRRVATWVAQLAVVAFVVWRIVRSVGTQWATVRDRLGALTPSWALIAASVVPVIVAYAVLVESWRRLIVSSGSRLSFADAWRIYMVSKLGVYVPGRVWQIAALGVLSRRAGVSPVAATASAVVGTLTNLAAGFAIVLIGGSRVVAAIAPSATGAATALGIAAAAGLTTLPFALPLLLRIAGRVTTRSLAEETPSPASLAFVVVANLASWVGYGIGFAVFERALVPAAGGEWLAGLTVFTASYLAGYLAIVFPGGLGVREAAMAEALTALHLTGPSDAWIVALASRLWLTVLEVVPGLVYLARDAALRSPSLPTDGPPA